MIRMVMYFSLFSVALLIMLTIFFSMNEFNCSNSFCLFVLGITLFQVIMYYMIGLKREKTIFSFWVRPSNILLLVLLIVNLQTLLNVFLGLGTISEYLDTLNYNLYVEKVFYFGCIGIVSFTLGNSFVCKRNVLNTEYCCRRKSTFIWTILALLTFCVWVVNIDIISFITGMDYQGSGAADREASSFVIFERLFDVFITINVAITTRNVILTKGNVSSFKKYIQSFPILLIIVVLFYLTLRLFSGDRGSVLYMGLLFFFSYVMCRRKSVKFLTIILFLILGAFFMTVLNVARGFRNPSETFAQRVERALMTMPDEASVKSVSPFTQELAGSVNCNFIAISDVDRGVTDLKYGAYNFCELISSIPGSNRISKSLFDVDLYEYSTSEYLTKSFLGENYMYGLGTTALADFYLDFGIIGVIVGMFFVGWFFKQIDMMIINPTYNIYALIATLKFSSMAIYIPRSSFSFVSCWVIYTIILYMFFSLLDLLGGKIKASLVTDKLEN